MKINSLLTKLLTTHDKHSSGEGYVALYAMRNLFYLNKICLNQDHISLLTDYTAHEEHNSLLTDHLGPLRVWPEGGELLGKVLLGPECVECDVELGDALVDARGFLCGLGVGSNRRQHQQHDHCKLHDFAKSLGTRLCKISGKYKSVSV
jgi:hypothetical protein